MSATELREVRRALRAARAEPAEAPLAPARAGRASSDLIDPRRTIRRSMRSEGEPIDRAFRHQKLVERRVVFICDISGSMEPYARALVLFLQAAVASGRQVEALTFGTRLTYLTPFLDGRDPDRALDRAAKAVRDWAGGTRIGESLDAFNRIYGRRGMTRGAIVVIASDGWERGDTTLLSKSMATPAPAFAGGRLAQSPEGPLGATSPWRAACRRPSPTSTCSCPATTSHRSKRWFA